MSYSSGNESIGIDERRLQAMLSGERTRWIEARPRSVEYHERAQRSLPHGTHQHWNSYFPAPVSIVVDHAEGARLHDIDGHTYADFALGDTAALWGHTNPAIAAAVRDQLERGTATFWEHEDHFRVSEELRRRFGLAFWQFTVSATDANRYALRLARVATGRQKLLVFNRAYHGSIDQAFAVIGPHGVEATPGVHPNGIDVAQTTKVVEFNDLSALEDALAPGDVAAVLAEPALTNGGSIVLPEPGFHDGLREITRRTGTLLIIDETQTIPAGPAGCTREFGLEPDLLTLGKSIAGGIPAGLYGMSESVAAAVADYTSTGHAGFGSTLAGGALPVRAMRVVLEEIMTTESYAWMHELAERYEKRVGETIADHRLPWHVVRLGARVAYDFRPQPPRNTSEVHTGNRSALRDALWLYCANRGVVTGVFAGTAIFSPLTNEADVDLAGRLFAEAVGQLRSDGSE